MRKLISLSVLALSLSMFSSTLFAEVGACDQLKGEHQAHGLFGMCVAYWNADESQKQRFLDKYNAIKDEHGGPPMPGGCLCWNGLSISAAIQDVESASLFPPLSVPSSFVYLFMFDKDAQVIRTFGTGWAPFYSCIFQEGDEDPITEPSILSEEGDICFENILDLDRAINGD